MWHLLMLLAIVSRGGALICSRRPANTAKSQTPVDENYVISITRNPETYILGQEYNVSLNSFNGHRYISFILALESENGEFNYMTDLGRFDLSDSVETRFSPNCINMVESTNPNPKTHVHLTWTAPSEPGSGCILIRATVLQHRDVWHMDDGGLTRRICEEVVDDVESQPTSLSLSNPCCACDEARYELIFEGVWSRNLHPRNFPERGWTTRFCELVGAAHSADYRFWEAGALASAGVKEYAEQCSSRSLDQEFSMSFREQKIRTIIKARGPAFPNLNSKTMASVRVDPVHHMVSFASKIEPSPDWIVGVSGLELCLRNCTWLENKVINLYPWDIGTDAGPSYNSSDQPQVPPDVIRRIRSDYPNDPRSPFYDETGAPMKPMAVLTIRRHRIYERRCLNEDSNNDVDEPRECHTHPWCSWSDCSSKCGEGMQYRRRVYKQPELARIYNCNVSLYEESVCEGQSCGLEEPTRNDFYMEMQQRPGYPQQQHAECQVSSWSGWSMCSVTCGEGFQMRQRQYLIPGAEMKCQGAHSLELTERQRCAGVSCVGNLPDGDGNGQYDEQQPENEEQSIDNNQNSYDFRAGDLGVGPDQGNPWSRPSSYSQIAYQRNPNKPENFGQRNKSNNREFVDSRQPSSRNQWTSNYAQPPRLDHAQRAPYQRGPERFSGQRQNSDIGDLADANVIGEIPMPHNQRTSNYRQVPPQRGPNQRRPSDSFNIQPELVSGQRQPNDNRDFVDPNAEVDPWQRESYDNQNSYDRAYNTNVNVANPDTYLSKRCFRMLQTNPPCKNETITGNFWFYNFCLDECMLYASDPCDRNVNKFSRFETCEECRRPEFRQLQQHAATSLECRDIIASHRADQQFWKEKHTRRRNQQRG